LHKTGRFFARSRKGKMPKNSYYHLPDLPFSYDSLWPFLTEQQVRIHHQHHHQAYVDNANKLLDELRQLRTKKKQADIKSLSRALLFNLSGHKLHTLFWENLKSKNQDTLPATLKKEIAKNFTSFENFKIEFSTLANSVFGSGWTALAYNRESDSLIIYQIEKHNDNILPNHKILLIIDVWEHAYYIDYIHNRGRYVDAFWEVVNWKKVDERLKKAKGMK